MTMSKTKAEKLVEVRQRTHDELRERIKALRERCSADMAVIEKSHAANEAEVAALFCAAQAEFLLQQERRQNTRGLIGVIIALCITLIVAVL